MSSLQIILLLIIAAITGIASVLDEGQTHRPLVQPVRWLAWCSGT